MRASSRDGDKHRQTHRDTHLGARAGKLQVQDDGSRRAVPARAIGAVTVLVRSTLSPSAVAAFGRGTIFPFRCNCPEGGKGRVEGHGAHRCVRPTLQILYAVRAALRTVAQCIARIAAALGH